MTVSSLAHAQAPSARLERLERLNAADVGTLTDARVNVVKTALQLTPDQEKYWPAIEDAIRARAKDRQTRIANAEKFSARNLGSLIGVRTGKPGRFMKATAER